VGGYRLGHRSSFLRQCLKQCKMSAASRFREKLTGELRNEFDKVLAEERYVLEPARWDPLEYRRRQTKEFRDAHDAILREFDEIEQIRGRPEHLPRLAELQRRRAYLLSSKMLRTQLCKSHAIESHIARQLIELEIKDGASAVGRCGQNDQLALDVVTHTRTGALLIETNDGFVSPSFSSITAGNVEPTGAIAPHEVSGNVLVFKRNTEGMPWWEYDNTKTIATISSSRHFVCLIPIGAFNTRAADTTIRQFSTSGALRLVVKQSDWEVVHAQPLGDISAYNDSDDSVSPY
jgi:hypothetical protein